MNCQFAPALALGLGVPHFFEDLPFLDSLPCIDVQCSKLQFGSGRHHGLDDFNDVQDCAIVWGERDVFRQEVVSPSLAPSIQLIEVAGVTVHSQDHVTFVVSEYSWLLCCAIDKECLTHAIVAVVGFACCAVRALSGMSNVPSTALPYHKNLPLTC